MRLQWFGACDIKNSAHIAKSHSGAFQPRHNRTDGHFHATGDYCDVYLTHDSMSVRKAHNSGRNHLRNVVEYYQQIGQEKAQSVIDSITSSYAAEGQAVPNPAMVPPGAYPPPFGFPGMFRNVYTNAPNETERLIDD
ncbi:putative U1 snRNP complex component Yhc1 [Aspergillus brunneoviolaceus CBS 621.78]|uniref:Uncharacterized protein n=1 Tax=Aspergillus brunneoviolaceus CBS 621.78 TaxID=1450534 RepID=A0ACD1G9U2_9EURO|nr:hypothetical protein BO95DRAFT_442375 [Aspergillus brunneoviolaceus CBS 621.78]RAH46003.1 hypothetical protein BO95DRAFT_442375 [Aspergillus brunneoviolaceus CBS 621.78]